MNHYKTKHVGIGGIKCPCCADKNAKRNVAREQRRKGKMELRRIER